MIRFWAVSEPSMFDFGSIVEPFLGTNPTRNGRSALFVHIRALPYLDVVHDPHTIYPKRNYPLKFKDWSYL